MGQRVLILKFDDLTGKTYPDDDIETVSFSLDGKAYTIDLCEENAIAFRALFDDYISKGQRDPSVPRRKSSKQAKPENAKIREWARAQGIEVSERGKIAQDVIDAYEASRHRPGDPPVLSDPRPTPDAAASADA